jgi:hypothetical protein
METAVKLFEINSMSFEERDQDVILFGKIVQDHMSYTTSILVSQTGLNKVINELYKQNEDCNVHELIQSEKIGYNETIYSAEFSSLLNRSVCLDKILSNQSLRQIRA